MGCCLSCPEDDDYQQVDPETRRQNQLDAAEKRRQDAEGRGIKDIEAYKRKEQRLQEAEKRQNQYEGNCEGGLRWQVD